MEEWSDEEVTITVLRTLKLIFKSDAAFDLIIRDYPSMGEFLTTLIYTFESSTAISIENIQCIESLLRRPHYIRYINSKIPPKLQAMKSE